MNKNTLGLNSLEYAALCRTIHVVTRNCHCFEAHPYFYKIKTAFSLLIGPRRNLPAGYQWRGAIPYVGKLD